MLLAAQDLSKHYRRGDVEVKALDRVSLEVEEGAFVTVTGPSGSGKTTLLLTLAGLLRPTSGRISFRDRSLENLSDARWAAFRQENLGFVMQNFSLVPYLTALENVALPLALRGAPREEQRRRAGELLERVGLDARTEHLPRELSAGQQQRVAIARALAGSPALVLADEPTGNLDPALARDVLALLRSLHAGGLAILMVTHSPEAAASGTARVHLEAGRIAAAQGSMAGARA
jgi:putative ABC transport system ATP-binding protein